jgi:hypothetical protein
VSSAATQILAYHRFEKQQTRQQTVLVVVVVVVVVESASILGSRKDCSCSPIQLVCSPPHWTTSCKTLNRQKHGY